MAEAEAGTLIEDACRSRGVCLEAIQKNRFRILPPLTITGGTHRPFRVGAGRSPRGAGRRHRQGVHTPEPLCNRLRCSATERRDGCAQVGLAEQPRDMGEQAAAPLTSWCHPLTKRSILPGVCPGCVDRRTATSKPRPAQVWHAPCSRALGVPAGPPRSSSLLPKPGRDSPRLRPFEGDVSPTWASGSRPAGSDASDVARRNYCRRQKKLPACTRPGRSLFDAKARSSIRRRFTRFLRCLRRYAAASRSPAALGQWPRLIVTQTNGRRSSTTSTHTTERSSRTS